MANPNPFLQTLEKEIALAIRGEADARTRTQENDTGNSSVSQSYSTEELAELIYYSAQSAAQTFQQDLSRQKSRLTLGTLPETTASPQSTTPSGNPLSPVDLLAQVTAILQIQNWLRSTNPILYSSPVPESDPRQQPSGTQILLNQLYQEESRSFQLQNQLTDDKLIQQRKQHLQGNFRRFLDQIPAEGKNQLLANIPAEIVLQNSKAGQIGVLHWIARSSVNQLALQLDPPLPQLTSETITVLISERSDIARQLKTGTKIVPGQQLQETRKTTLDLLQRALSPHHFPDPKQIAAATITKLRLVLPQTSFPAEALQEALNKNVSATTDQGTEQKLWAQQHENLRTQYALLPPETRLEIEYTTGSLQAPLASALAAATHESPADKQTLLLLASLLATGQRALEPTLETVNSLLILQRQLQSESKTLQIKIDPAITQASQAVFDPDKIAEANPSALNALRRFKNEGEALILKLQGIASSRNNLVFANPDALFPARLERALGLAQLHPVLRQGISHHEITREIITLLKERHAPLQSLQNLHVAHVVDKPAQDQPPHPSQPLQKAAFQAEKENNPAVFYQELENTIRAVIGATDKAQARQTLTAVAEVLRYLPLQPPLDPRLVQITEQKIIAEILRHAKSNHDNELEAQFTNPSEADMRVVTFQAQKQVEHNLTDKIARTIRKNAESLDQQRLALAQCFQTRTALAAAWTRKETAEESLVNLHETRTSQIVKHIDSLEAALSVIETAKELKTIQSFKAWITKTHSEALRIAQQEYTHDPFDISLRTRVQELTQFGPELENGRTAAQDPAGNLDIRVVWEILAQNKTNLQRQIDQLKDQQRELARTIRAISDPQAIEDLNAKSNGSKSFRQHAASHGFNSLTRAFDEAFNIRDLAASSASSDLSDPTQIYQYHNPFEGQPLEVILDAGNRQRQLQAKAAELHAYWTDFIGTPAAQEINPTATGSSPIEAAAKLLLFHEIARFQTKPEIPSEINQMWLRQAARSLQISQSKAQVRELDAEQEQPDKNLSLISI